ILVIISIPEKTQVDSTSFSLVMVLVHENQVRGGTTLQIELGVHLDTEKMKASPHGLNIHLAIIGHT
ncbi:MAG: hypothetical protein MJA29_08370, partial [Candidatus Omnitrophica bacterium]|nr:hypothetical protein [Candidatus Omnitrophota bacterium]